MVRYAVGDVTVDDHLLKLVYADQESVLFCLVQKPARGLPTSTNSLLMEITL